MRNRIAKLIEEDGAKNPSVLFLTADLGFSVVEGLQESFGDRFINVGVAEANLMSMAASLAASGFTPFTYSIAPFVTARCFEQIRNDIAYQKRRVRIVGVGAGFSYGSLGPSHHALEDAHLMCAAPGFIVGNPRNVDELDQFYELAAQSSAPVYFRIGRESGQPGAAHFCSLDNSAYVVRDGGDLTLIGSGATVASCLVAADYLATEKIFARVISVPVLAPFPTARLSRLLGHGEVVSVFEGYRGNPLSVGVMQTILMRSERNRFIDIFAHNEYAAVVGDTEFQRRAAGLDPQSIVRRCREQRAS